MTRIIILLGASATALGSLAAGSASTPAPPRIISQTEDGKPILLGRMVVTATPLGE